MTLGKINCKIFRQFENIFFSLMARLHWQSAILRGDIAFLTCLGQVTEIEMILSVLRRPRGGKASKEGDIASQYR
jgi:hypothetical protein